MRGLIDRADQVLDLFRVWTELFGELVEIRIGDRRKAPLVYVIDNLDAERFQLCRRRFFQFERLCWLLGADLSRRCRHPLLLFGRQALPQLSLTNTSALLASCSVIDSTGATS